MEAAGDTLLATPWEPWCCEAVTEGDLKPPVSGARLVTPLRVAALMTD